MVDLADETFRLKAKVDELLALMAEHASCFDEDGECWCLFCFGPLTEAAEAEHEKGKPEDEFKAVDFSHLTDCPLKIFTPMGALEAAGQLNFLEEPKP